MLYCIFMASKELTIINKAGLKLTATIENVTEKTDYIVILLHGFSSGRNRETTRVLAEELSRRGINSIRFDMAGCGQSEGYLGDQTLTLNVSDLESVYAYCKELGYERISIFGSSYGGLNAIAFAFKEKNIFRVGLKAPVSSLHDVWLNKLGEDTFNAWETDGFIEYVSPSGDVFKIKHDFYLDSKKYDIYNQAKDIDIPTLIIHGDYDKTVDIKQSKKIVENLSQGSLIVIEGAGHDLAIDGDRMQVTKMFADWFEKGL